MGILDWGSRVGDPGLRILGSDPGRGKHSQGPRARDLGSGIHI